MDILPDQSSKDTNQDFDAGLNNFMTGGKAKSLPNYAIACILSVIRIVAGVVTSSIAVFWIQSGPYGPLKTLSNGLTAWDGSWYRYVAMNGYSIANSRVLFPIYPIFIHLVTFVTRNYNLSALIISWISLVFATNGIINLIKKLGGSNKSAIVAALSLLWFPESVFFTAGYAESFYLACLIWTIVYIMEKQWWLTAVTGFLAVGTRPEGAIIVVAIFIGLLVAKEPWHKVFIVPAIAGSSLVAYILFLWIKYRQPLAFVTEQSFWDRKTTWPLGAEFESLFRIANHTLVWPGKADAFNAYSLYLTDDFGAFLATLAAIYCVYRTFKDRRYMPVAIYAVLIIFVAYTSAPYGGVSPDVAGRIAMCVPAVYVMISKIKLRYFMIFIFPIFVTTALAWQIAFSSGRWIT